MFLMGMVTQVTTKGQFPATELLVITLRFVSDTTVVDQIMNNNRKGYKKEMDNFTTWCQDNNFSLNVCKKKDPVIDFRKCGGVYAPISVNGAEMEMVESFKFFGVNIEAPAKKTHLRLEEIQSEEELEQHLRTLSQWIRYTQKPSISSRMNASSLTLPIQSSIPCPTCGSVCIPKHWPCQLPQN